MFGSDISVEGKRPVIPIQQSLKNKPHLKLILQYDKTRYMFGLIFYYLYGFKYICKCTLNYLFLYYI